MSSSQQAQQQQVIPMEQVPVDLPPLSSLGTRETQHGNDDAAAMESLLLGATTTVDQEQAVEQVSEGVERVFMELDRLAEMQQQQLEAELVASRRHYCSAMMQVDDEDEDDDDEQSMTDTEALLMMELEELVERLIKEKQ